MTTIYLTIAAIVAIISIPYGIEQLLLSLLHDPGRRRRRRR